MDRFDALMQIVLDGFTFEGGTWYDLSVDALDKLMSRYQMANNMDNLLLFLLDLWEKGYLREKD